MNILLALFLCVPNIYTYIYTCVFEYFFVWDCTCVYGCVDIYIYMYYMYRYICVYIHIYMYWYRYIYIYTCVNILEGRANQLDINHLIVLHKTPPEKPSFQ